MTGRLGAAADLRFNQTVREFVAFVSELGLDHVEFKREYLQAPPEAPPPAEIATILEAADMSCTLHAPFRDCNVGSFNDNARAAAETMVIDTLNDAATIWVYGDNSFAEVALQRLGLANALPQTASRWGVAQRPLEVLAGVETGNRAGAFVYKNMAVDHGLPAVTLPDELNFSNPAYADRYAQATYTLEDGTTVETDW